MMEDDTFSCERDSMLNNRCVHRVLSKNKKSTQGRLLKGVDTEESINEFLMRRDRGEREMLARISPRCIRFSPNKSIWKVMFLALFSSVLTYYGIFQLLMPWIVKTANKNYLVTLISVIVAITFYIFFIWLSIRYKLFNTTNMLFLYGGLFLISMTGLVTSLCNVIPLEGYEILKMFAVVLFINIIMIIISFYVTRMAVCKIKDKPSNE